MSKRFNSFIESLFFYLMCGHTYSKSMDHPGKVANPVQGQLHLSAKQEKITLPCPRSRRLRIWSRETGLAVPSRFSLIISIRRLDLVLTYEIPPEFRGGFHL